MYLSTHSLLQIDDSYLDSLDLGDLLALSKRLLADLKEAHEKLGQGPNNSSRPPSSQTPWERLGAKDEDDIVEEEGETTKKKKPTNESGKEEVLSLATVEEQAGKEAPTEPVTTVPVRTPKKPGKQPGAPGFGRTQVFEPNEVIDHYPESCAGCSKPTGAQEEMVAYTAYQTVDVRWGDSENPGLRSWVTEHRYYESICACGHHTRAIPGQGEVDPLLPGVKLSEWRLVGPGLAALIASLNCRFRMSRARVQEFLWDWLGLKLSTGTIQQTIEESAAAVTPAEEEMIAEIRASELLHADETSWPEGKSLLWLWVFVSPFTVLYYIAGRGKELVANVLEGFGGWLMTDGFGSYRGYLQRLRCWAHLLRKARGLAESYNPEARVFGEYLLTTLTLLMKAVYTARVREGPLEDFHIKYREVLAELRATCERMRDSAHAKTHALAVEFLNDWDAIFQVLHHPELPLTNNDAERALRHWVIARRISHGSRSEVGSRSTALLASVIDTCRKRGHSPWKYLRTAIRDRRAGCVLAPLPPAPVGV
jgi:hypothetical protein